MRTNKFLTPIGFSEEIIQRLVSGKTYRVKKKKTQEEAGDTSSGRLLTPPAVFIDRGDRVNLVVPEYNVLPQIADFGSIVIYGGSVYVYLNEWVPLGGRYNIPEYDTLPSHPLYGEVLCYFENHLYYWDGTSFVRSPLVYAHVGSTPPTNPLTGDLWFNGGILYVYDNTWKPVVAVIEKGDVLPQSGEEGELFFKSDEGALYVYHNGSWLPVRETGIGTQFPTIYQNGYLFYRTDEQLLYVRTSSGWVPINAITNYIVVGTQFPQTATVGKLCYRTDRQLLYVYSGGGWEPCDRVAVGTDFPPSPYNGMMFYHTDQKRLYVYHSGVWLKPETVSYGNSLPPSPAIGELFFRADENRLYVYNTGGWVGAVNVAVSNQFPSNPRKGDIVYRTDINSIWVYDGTQWRTHERVTVGSSLPAGFEGRLFFNTSTNKLMVFSNNQWRDAIPPAPRETGAGSSFPSNPEHGYLFYRTDENRLYVYNTNNSWVPTNLVNIVTTLPTTAQEGSLVFNSSNNTLYVRSGNKWVTTHGIRSVSSLPTSADYGAIVYNETDKTFYINTSSTSTPVWVRSETVSRGTSFPSSPTAGQVFFRTDQNKFYVFNGTSWVDVSGGENNIIPTVTSFPSSPAQGTLVYRTDINSYWVYDGSNWRTSEYVSFGDTLPSGFEGRVFYRTTDRRLYVYQNGRWLPLADAQFVVATDYASFNEAVNEAISQNRPLFVPRGTYTWSGGNYGSNTLVLIGEAGTVVNTTNVIQFSANGSFYAENISFVAINREYTSKMFLNKPSSSGKNGVFFLKNCSITTDYTTDMNFYLINAFVDTLYLDEVEIQLSVLGTSSGGLRFINGDVNRFAFFAAKFIAPNVNTNTQTPLNQIFFQNGVIADSAFVNVRNNIRPDTTTIPSLVIFRSLFEFTNNQPISYWDNVVSALDIGSDTHSLEAVISQSSFYNRADQKLSPIWAVLCRTPLKLIVTECYFENVVGIRTAAASDLRYYNPNNLSVLLVTNSVFRNCKGNAMELQTVDVMVVKDNEFSCEGNFDLPPNFHYGHTYYGICIRLRNHIVEDANAEPYEEAGLYRVCWVEGNKIKGYPKAGIWVEGRTTHPKHRRIRYYIYNNLIEKINYEETLSPTEHTSFLNTFDMYHPFRGSAIVIGSDGSTFYNFTNATSAETKGNRIYRCYHGIALFRCAIDGSTPNNEIVLHGDTVYRTYVPSNGNGWDFYLYQFTGAVLIRDAYFRSIRAEHVVSGQLRVNVVRCYLDQPTISTTQTVTLRVAECVVRDSGGNIWNAGLIPVSSSPPASPQQGSIYYDTTLNSLRIYNGTNWNNFGSSYLHGFGSSFPSNPNVGDIFYRTDLNRLFMWNGSQWLSQTALPTSAPSNPVTGDMYFDSSNNRLYIRTGVNWRLVGIEDGSATSISRGTTLFRSYGSSTNRYAPLDHAHGFEIVESKTIGSVKQAIYREPNHPLYYFHRGFVNSQSSSWFLSDFSFNRPFRIDNKQVSNGQNDITLENIPNTPVRVYMFKVLDTEVTQTDFYFEQSLDFMSSIQAAGSGTFHFDLVIYIRGTPNFSYRFLGQLIGYRMDADTNITVSTSTIVITPPSSGYGVGGGNATFSLSTAVFPAFTFRLTRLRSQENVGNRPDTCYVMPFVSIYFNG